MGATSARLKPIDIRLKNGYAFRIKANEQSIHHLKNQPGIKPGLACHIVPEGRIGLSVTEIKNPSIVRFLSPNGDIHRYYKTNGQLLRIPFGFSSFDAFRLFGDHIKETLKSIGIHDAEVYVIGSAASGRSFVEGRPFDDGRVSDIEIEIRSRTLYNLQVQKFSELVKLYQERYLPEYQKAYEEAKTKEQKKSTNDDLVKIKGIVNRLEKMLKNGKLPPNYKLPLGFQDLQYRILPSYTDRDYEAGKTKVGIRISHPDLPESSDINESSILIS